MADAKHRKVMLDGVVVSASMNKTISVRVDRLMKHPKYSKYVTKSRKFLAHDETEEAAPGDKVRIVECRPMSKRKRWRLKKVLAKAHQDAAGEVAE